MGQATIRHVAADEETEMRVTIDESFVEMEKIRAEVKQMQASIGHSEERTNKLAAETKAILARIEATIHAKAAI